MQIFHLLLIMGCITSGHEYYDERFVWLLLMSHGSAQLQTCLKQTFVASKWPGEVLMYSHIYITVISASQNRHRFDSGIIWIFSIKILSLDLNFEQFRFSTKISNHFQQFRFSTIISNNFQQFWFSTSISNNFQQFRFWTKISNTFQQFWFWM